MFGLFNKKQKATIGDHISYIIDSKTNFQLDILRQGDIDFQIFRQRLLKHLGTSVDNPNGIAFLIPLWRAFATRVYLIKLQKRLISQN